MSNALATRPATTEYDPYYERYISLVPDADVVQTLSAQLEATLKELSTVSGAQAGYRYAPDKWSIKEVIGHVVDTERIFAYRALRFARNDHTPIEGYDQDEFARYGGFDERTLADLAQELEHVRRANLLLFSSFNETALERHGLANQVEVSVRALLYILAGHERHHMNVLKTRYLSAL